MAAEAQLTSKPYKRRYTLYTALLAIGMMLTLYLLLGVWPFGDGTVLTGDLGGLYINFYAHFKRALLGEASFAYGFDKGLGGSMVGLFAYYCASPYNLLYLLFPLRWFPVAASLAFLAKIVLSCVTFRIYMAARAPHLGWRSVALSLCYGFMAYCFAYAQNPMWHDCIVLLPLVCLGIDRIVQGKPLTVYALSLGLAILSDFYIAFMVCLFAGLYFFWSMLTASTKAGWKAPLVRFTAGSLLAGGSCAALLLPALANINQNKGDLLSLDFSLSPYFSLLRLPERLVWGSFDTLDVEGHLPFLFCGIPVLVLVLCYFFGRTVALREKLCSGGMIVLFLLSFWLQGLDNIWHGFKEPIWFPARYSFIFCFFLILLAGRAFATKAVTRHTLFLAGGLVMAALLLMTVFPIAISRKRLIVSEIWLIICVFLLLYYTMTTSWVRKRVITGTLALVVAAELLSNAFFIARGFDQYSLSGFQGFVAEAGGTIDAIHAADEDTGYRIGEDWMRTLNDPLLLGYKGMSHFASTQDGPAQSVLYNLGHRNYEGGGPYLSGGTAFADGVLGIRYLAASGNRAAAPHWQLTSIEAPYAVYQNTAAMPMAFTIPQTGGDGRTPIYEEDLFACQNDFAAMLGADDALFTPVNNVQLVTQEGAPVQDLAAIPPESRYEITAEADGHHYAYLTSPHYQLITLLVNGNASAPYFSPDYAGVIDLGWLNAGDTAVIRFLAHEDFIISTAYFARMDGDILSNLVTSAHQSAGSFTFTDGLVTGSITAHAGRETLYTAIPYDENWQATVNGETASPFMVMGGLLCVPLQPGENKVTLTYVPAAGTMGAVLSIVCLLGLAGAIAAETALGRQKRRLAPPTQPTPETKPED